MSNDATHGPAATPVAAERRLFDAYAMQIASRRILKGVTQARGVIEVSLAHSDATLAEPLGFVGLRTLTPTWSAGVRCSSWSVTAPPSWLGFATYLAEKEVREPGPDPVEDLRVGWDLH